MCVVEKGGSGANVLVQRVVCLFGSLCLLGIRLGEKKKKLRVFFV